MDRELTHVVVLSGQNIFAMWLFLAKKFASYWDMFGTK